jgi:hypothetical protein
MGRNLIPPLSQINLGHPVNMVVSVSEIKYYYPSKK